MTLKNELAWIVRRRLLPRPAKSPTQAHKDGPVFVAGLFSTANGIGRSARLHHEALRKAGISCKAIDLSPLFGIADMDADIQFEAAIPRGLTGTLLVCLNPLEAEAALYTPPLRAAKGWRIIGSWVWELPQAPRSWISRAKQYTEIWTPSDFSKKALERVSSVPVKTVPLCLSDTSRIAAEEPASSGMQRARFLIAADGWSSFERKNVLGGLKAYKLAIPEPGIARLLIKCRNLEKHAEFERQLKTEIGERSDITIMSETVSDSEMNAVLASCDAVISLHRSEGFGLVLAEAMLQAKTVIATGWSGNLQFMDDDSAILIDHALIAVDDPFDVYRGALWADPDIQQAALAIRRVAADAPFRREIGLRARAVILSKLNPEMIAKALGV